MAVTDLTLRTGYDDHLAIRAIPCCIGNGSNGFESTYLGLFGLWPRVEVNRKHRYQRDSLAGVTSRPAL
jgi:hypothetical protein